MSASPMPERRALGTTPTPPIQASSPRTPRFASPTGSPSLCAIRDASRSKSKALSMNASRCSSMWNGRR
jgi:hypothetical protein